MIRLLLQVNRNSAHFTQGKQKKKKNEIKSSYAEIGNAFNTPHILNHVGANSMLIAYN